MGHKPCGGGKFEKERRVSGLDGFRAWALCWPIEIDRSKLAKSVAALAKRGVYVGTSSWKYPGWIGQIYSKERYEHFGKFDEKAFKMCCLVEYGQVFKTVGVDATYYTFPKPHDISRFCEAVPDDFLAAYKVTGQITIKKFTRHGRYAKQAGELNKEYLNADLFESAFLAPMADCKKRVGLLMFEFSKFYPGDYARGRDFLADLDRFFTALPGGWPYGVEIRNQNFLKPDYFELLKKHGVAHVFNNWTAMPTVGEQMAIAGSLPNPNLCGARFLLTPGRKYQEAVDEFGPYTEVLTPDAEARAAGAKLIAEGAATPGRRTLIFVNNRMEGNALGTITAMLEEAERG